MRLENLIQRALVRAVIGNKWWVSLKYRIRDFAIKYSQQLALDRAKKAKSLEDRLSRAVEGGDSIAIDLAKGDLERSLALRYKGFVVRNRLKRVPNEAVKCNAFMHKEELRRFPCRYIECVNAPDRRAEIEPWDSWSFPDTLSRSLCPLSWPPGSGVSWLFGRLPSPWGGGNG